MKTVTFTILFFVNLVSWGQGNETPDIANLPQYPGELKAFYAYVSKNLKYPETAKQKNIAGRVWVEFYIKDDGTIDYEAVKIVKGLDKECDEEAIRLIKESKGWIPGKRNGKPSREKLTLYIPFVSEPVK